MSLSRAKTIFTPANINSIVILQFPSFDWLTMAYELQKYARIFVFGHYLFREVNSFPRASLSENCSLLGTDNVRGQISVHIFAPNGDYCSYRQ